LGPIMRKSLIVVVLLSVASDGLAQPQDVGSVAYYCVGDAAGGLSYNEKAKKWEGASFRLEQKFVLKMNFAGARVQKGMMEEEVTDYNVMVTASGKDTGLPCTTNDPNDTITVADRYRSFSCTTVAYTMYSISVQIDFFPHTVTATWMARIPTPIPHMSKAVRARR
jgi:hypothetical protein